MVNQIGSALAAAHRKGILHRDIKPANILLDAEGNAFLTDFSIGQTDAVGQPTSISTSRFTSPEQRRGEMATERSDCYAFGLLVSQVLVGNAERPNGNLPPAVSAILQQATADNPAERFASVGELAQRLQTALASEVALPPIDVLVEGNPYKGLRAFQESDSELFFGRTHLIDQLLNQLRSDRFLAVVGPSGSGKSSVVRAGVLPQLRSGMLRDAENWFTTTIIPGTHPLEELEAALLRVAVEPPESLIEPLQKDERGLIRTLKRILPANDAAPSQLLLVIDQFEELFTLSDDSQRQQFVDNLLAALDAQRSQLRVIVTLRADFYDKPLQVPGLAQHIQNNNVVVTPLTAVELEQAIVQPAALACARFADGLVTRIVDDVRDQPGILPLLQYALTEVFERRRDNVITLDVYEAIGGVTGALGREAERIYGGFSVETQSLTRQIFLRLITLGEGAEDTRRRVLRSELEALVDARAGNRQQLKDNGKLATNGSPFAILSAFGDARLLSFDHDPITREPTVEVAHEALLREWLRLRGWLDESRDDVRLQRRLNSAVADWIESGRDNAYLLRGSQIERFARLTVDTDVILTPDEIALLETSTSQHRKAKQELDWIRAQANLTRVPHPPIPRPEDATISSLALTPNEQAFLKASRSAAENRRVSEKVRERRELEQAQKLAETERQRAEEQTQAAGRLRQRALLLAGALAIAGVLAVAAFIFGQSSSQNAELATTREAEAQESAAIAQAAAKLALDREVEAHENLLLASTQEAIAEQQAELAQENADLAATREQEAQLQAVIAQQNADLATTREAEARTARTNALEQARLSLARELAASAIKTVSENAELSMLLSMQSLDIVHTWEAEAALHQALQANKLRKSVKLDNGEPFLVRGKDGWLLMLLPRTDAESSEVTVWDLETEELLYSVPRFTWLQSISADGTMLVTSNCQATNTQIDCDLIVRNVQTGEEIDHPLVQTYQFGANDVTGILIHPDWQHIVLPFSDGHVEISTSDQDAIVHLEGHKTDVIAVAFNEDGSLIVTTDSSGEMILWDYVATLERNRAVKVAQWTVNEGTYAGLYTKSIYERDGRTFVIVEIESGTVTLAIWEVIGDSAVLISQQPDRENTINDYTISEDGRRIVSVGNGGTVYVSDFFSGEDLYEITGSGISLFHVEFNEDETQLIGTSQDGQVFYWDASPVRNEVRSFASVDSRTLRTTVSQDGKYAAFGSAGSVTVLNLDSGEAHLQLSAEVGGLRVAPFHPNGEEIATGGYDGIIRIHDLNSGEVLQQWQAHVGGPPDTVSFWPGIWGLDYSPDGTLLASSRNSAFGEGEAKLWDAESGELIFELLSYETAMMAVDFSPDGNYVAVHAGDNGVHIFDVATGETVWQLEGLIFGVGLEFSPDGSKVAGTSDLGRFKVWDMATGESAYDTRTLSGFVAEVQFSPDGNYILTADDSGTVVWDAHTGEELFELADKGLPTEFEFTSEGRLIGTDFATGQVAEFTFYLEDALALARERVTRGLTEQECLQYLRSADCSVSFAAVDD